MTTFVHSEPDDDPFDGLELHAVEKRGEYEGTDGWIVALHVPDDATLRRVLDRWGPK